MQFFRTKRKWFSLGIYKPQKQDNSQFLETMNILLNDCMETYENIIILGGFSMTLDNPQLNGFMQLLDMSHLNNELTCFNQMIQPALTTF